MNRLEDAKRAHTAGTATPEQSEIVKNEAIGEIMKQKKEEEKQQRPLGQLKRYLFGGLKTDASSTSSSESAAGSSSNEQNKPGVLDALNAKAAEDAKASQQQPGQLDVLADNVESAAKQTTRSWTSWFTGR